jgi:hypothetical protein
MLILAAFAAIALIAAGLFAINTGDGAAYLIALVVLVVLVLAVAPQVPTLMTHLQHAIDARIPIALR